LEAAALLEPLSVAIHSTRRASIEQGDTAIVFGAGTVGLLVAAMAKLCGATTVLIADIDAGRVEYALRNRFATRGFVVPRMANTDCVAEKMAFAKELANDIVEQACAGEPDFEGADVAFDCTGKEICMQTGLYVRFLQPLSIYQNLQRYRRQDQVAS
jgi:L-iditol 2-dehydrogenase